MCPRVAPTEVRSIASDAKIDRVEIATGSHRPAGFPVVSLYSGGAWKGIRLQQGWSGPGELPEGYLTRHVVAVHVGGAISAEMWWPGKRYTRHRIAPGNVHVFPAGMPYACRWSARHAIVIDIAPEFVESVAGRDLDQRHREVRPAFGTDDDLVAHLALALAEEVRAGTPGGSLYGEGLGTALVAHLLRFHGVVTRRVRGVRALSAAELGRVKQYIGDNLETNLSLQELADVVGMNLYRFVRSFKQSTGVPPHRYVLQQRIERAKSLLANSEVPIVEVALRAGFAGQSNFSTAFHRLTSITPRRYREAVRCRNAQVS
jgi:AraC family transcriptional regulator